MSFRRLLVTGFPCPASAWKPICQGLPGITRILTLSELIGAEKTGHPIEWSKKLAQEISEWKPDSLLAHDVGVTISLLALLKLGKSPDFHIPRVTLFNGAFRGFDVFKSIHPFLMQLATPAQIFRRVSSDGGVVDPAILKQLPQMRIFYRYVILNSLRERMTKRVPIRSRTPEMQLLRSDQDRYIPQGALDQMERDFPGLKAHRVVYGHFPYSNPSAIERIQVLITSFENGGARV